MVHCPDEADLALYAEAALDDASSAALRRHVSDCGDCRRRLADLSDNLNLVGQVQRLVRPAHAADVMPRRIGAFELVRELGRGGMGVVYEARQQHPRRTVALKVMTARAAGDERHARLFEREVELLAGLAHPGIASLHEAGRTADGQAYFAMELVRGVTLREHVAAQNPPLRARLELFRRVCDAVAFAHQRGVIHRDLKPANILIAGDPPMPKVLDFGLARTVASADDSKALTLTHAGRVEGTLAYMSPEQARGDSQATDVRSDVYSLGVILYELLTGRHPLDLQRGPMHETLAAICERDPRRPSAHDARLRGDVDAIVLKSLEKDADRRYSSAAALGDDVARFLANQPIVARTPTLAYQFTMLVRRHRTAAALSAAALVTLTGFGVWMATLYAEADRLRRSAVDEGLRAIAARDESQALNAFLQQMLESADPSLSSGQELTLRELLDQAARSLRDGTFAGSAEAAAALRHTIGKTYHALGVYSTAIDELGAVAEERAARLGADHESTTAALADLALALGSAGRYDEAEAAVRDVIARAGRAGRGESAEMASHRYLLGMILNWRGSVRDAADELAAAVSMFRQHVGERAEETLRARGEHAAAIAALDQFSEAESTLRELLSIRRENSASDDPRIASAATDLAIVLKQRGRYDDAEPLLVEALQIRTALHGPNHPKVARALAELAALLADKPDTPRCEQTYREAIRIYRDTVGEQHPEVARCKLVLAQAIRDQGRTADAEPLLAEALDVARHAMGERSALVGNIRTNQGVLYTMMRRFDDALAAHTDAIDILVGVYGRRHTNVASAFSDLANYHHTRGDWPAAERAYLDAIEVYTATYGFAHPQVAVTWVNLGFMRYGKRDFPGSAEALGNGVRSREAFGDDERRVASDLANWGLALCDGGEIAAALSAYDRSLAMHQRLGQTQTREYASALRGKARALGRVDRPAEAEAPLREALALDEALFPPGHYQVHMTRATLGACLRDLGRLDEADALLSPAYDALRELRGDADRHTVNALRHLIQLCERRGETERAEVLRARLPVEVVEPSPAGHR